MKESFDEWPATLLEYRRGYRALVALNEQGELLAACWFVAHHFYCPAFATRREFRGQGIGKAMAAELKAIADGEQVVPKIAAELGSVALWQRWGFRGCRNKREDEWARLLDAEYGVFTRASTQLMFGMTRDEIAFKSCFKDRCWAGSASGYVGGFRLQRPFGKTRVEVAYRDRCRDQLSFSVLAEPFQTAASRDPPLEAGVAAVSAAAATSLIAPDAASAPLRSCSSSPPSAPPLASPSVAPPSAAPSTCQPADSRDPPFEAGVASVSVAAATLDGVHAAALGSTSTRTTSSPPSSPAPPLAPPAAVPPPGESAVSRDLCVSPTDAAVSVAAATLDGVHDAALGSTSTRTTSSPP